MKNMQQTLPNMTIWKKIKKHSKKYLLFHYFGWFNPHGFKLNPGPFIIGWRTYKKVWHARITLKVCTKQMEENDNFQFISIFIFLLIKLEIFHFVFITHNFLYKTFTICLYLSIENFFPIQRECSEWIK